jgi:hypothetical protein
MKQDRMRMKRKPIVYSLRLKQSLVADAAVKTVVVAVVLVVVVLQGAVHLVDRVEREDLAGDS